MVNLLAPVIRGKKGEYKELFADIAKDGFVRVRVDKKIYEIAEAPAVNKKVRHNVESATLRMPCRPKRHPSWSIVGEDSAPPWWPTIYKGWAIPTFFRWTEAGTAGPMPISPP